VLLFLQFIAAVDVAVRNKRSKKKKGTVEMTKTNKTCVAENRVVDLLASRERRAPVSMQQHRSTCNNIGNDETTT